jgi:hypothetical protein
VIFSFSGHCFPAPCGLRRNPEYLEAGGTPTEIERVIESHGYWPMVLSYADEFYNRAPDGGAGLPDGDEEIEDYGFLQALSDMVWVQENWVANYDNPSRSVVLAHSHGTVWAHAALVLYPEMDVDILIDLDGVSTGWRTDTWTFGVGEPDSDAMRWVADQMEALYTW